MIGDQDAIRAGFLALDGSLDGHDALDDDGAVDALDDLLEFLDRAGADALVLAADLAGILIAQTDGVQICRDRHRADLLAPLDALPELLAVRPGLDRRDGNAVYLADGRDLTGEIALFLVVAEPCHAARVIAALDQRVRVSAVVVEEGAVKGVVRQNFGDRGREDRQIELLAEERAARVGDIILMNGVELDADVRQPADRIQKAAVVALRAELQRVGVATRAGDAVADLADAARGIEYFSRLLLILCEPDQNVVQVHGMFHF